MIRTLFPLVLGAALGALGCAGHDARPHIGVASGALVENPGEPLALSLAPGERILAVADDGTRGLALTNQAAIVFRGGRVERIGAARPFTKAVFLPAPDGPGTWAVALDAEGQLWRVRPGLAIEPVSALFGLGADRVLDVVGAGRHALVARLADGVALVSAKTEDAGTGAPFVARYPAPALVTLAASSTMLALAYEDHVETVELAIGHDGPRTLARRSFDLAGVLAVAIPRGEKASDAPVFATRRAVYRLRSGTSELTLVARADAKLNWLTAAGDGYWAADGETLRHFDAAFTPDVARATSHDDILAAAGDGTLLVGNATGLIRLRPAPLSVVADWEPHLRPIFDRACADCHREDGKAGVDLSTGPAWLAARDEIVERTLRRHTMPPGNRRLSEDDRTTLEAWAKRTERSP